MAVDRTGAGDPARTLELLWRTREPPAARRGPQRGLSIDAIVGEAIELADAEGLAAVTMRRIAARLEVAPMTLYGYVPSKAELLDLMLDSVYAGMPRTRSRRRGPAGCARDDRPRQPRPLRGPPLGGDHLHRPSSSGPRPHGQVRARALRPRGDGPGRRRDGRRADLPPRLRPVLRARGPRGRGTARSESESDDEQWWAANAPLLAQRPRRGRPIRSRRAWAARPGAAQGTAFDPARAYSFGLERVLDGLEMLVEDGAGARSARGPDAPAGVPAIEGPSSVSNMRAREAPADRLLPFRPRPGDGCSPRAAGTRSTWPGATRRRSSRAPSSSRSAARAATPSTPRGPRARSPSATRRGSGERTNGPNFNQRKETRDTVLYAIRNGGFSGAIMPANIVVGRDAEAVADFVVEVRRADLGAIRGSVAAARALSGRRRPRSRPEEHPPRPRGGAGGARPPRRRGGGDARRAALAGRGAA